MINGRPTIRLTSRPLTVHHVQLLRDGTIRTDEHTVHARDEGAAVLTILNLPELRHPHLPSIIVCGEEYAYALSARRPDLVHMEAYIIDPPRSERGLPPRAHTYIEIAGNGEITRANLVLDYYPPAPYYLSGMRHFVLTDGRFYLDADHLARDAYRDTHPTCELCGTEDTVRLRDPALNLYLCDTCDDPEP